MAAKSFKKKMVEPSSYGSAAKPDESTRSSLKMKFFKTPNKPEVPIPAIPVPKADTKQDLFADLLGALNSRRTSMAATNGASTEESEDDDWDYPETISIKKATAKSIFDDDDNRSSGKSKSKKKSSGLFDDDDDLFAAPAAGVVRKKSPTNGSLFGDDDDDLFSAPKKDITKAPSPAKPIVEVEKRLEVPVAMKMVEQIQQIEYVEKIEDTEKRLSRATLHEERVEVTLKLAEPALKLEDDYYQMPPIKFAEPVLFEEELLPAKDDVAEQRLLSYLRHSLLLHRLSPSERTRLVEAMTPRIARAGETVLRAGDTNADYFYLVDKGELEVLGKRKSRGGDECVAVLRAGDTFGELALWYDTPRNATVRARTQCVLWVVERTKFVELLGYKKHQFEPWIKVLERVDLLKSLMPYELKLIAYASSVLRVNSGDVLCREGAAPDSFYVVLSGSFMEFSGTQKGQTYTKHASIGAEELLARASHPFSVKATTFAEVLVLNRSYFAKLVAPHIRVESA
eukprot:Phypoly_transcript_04859.p1 GENE.Phypoly_transcript_04859~~Phypoly_transcript_04859.p1  ORF type:complete len:512 (+),score=120.41 Phypoly_transcript_04859:492-2027(+)